MKLGSKIWVGFRLSLGYNNWVFFIEMGFGFFAILIMNVLNVRFWVEGYWLWVISAQVSRFGAGLGFEF